VGITDTGHPSRSPHPPDPGRPLQPALHDLLTAVRGPTAALSGRDGQIRPTGAHGVFHADVRVLSAAVLTVDGREPESIAATIRGADTVWCAALVREAGDEGADPTVRIDRERRVRPGVVTETIRVCSTAAATQHLSVEVTVAADLAPVEEVKAGVRRPAVRPGGGPVESVTPTSTSEEPVTADTGVPAVTAEGGAPAVTWRTPAVTTRVIAPGAAVAVDTAGAVLRWELTVPTGVTHTLSWSSTTDDHGAVVVATGAAPVWSVPVVRADDRRFAALVEQALADLDALRMATAADPGAEFLAAGSPWYATLFGRDSIWAARMLLPLGTGLALGTLRTLAGLQGTRNDPHTGEAPGKILHELRRAGGGAVAPERPGGARLPPAYYGTVDATPLWVLLLHDAWRAGLPDADVEPLLDTAERALGWIAAAASPATEPGDGEAVRPGALSGHHGFIAYVDRHGTGLSNQGWKDSADSVRFADGSRAVAPIALCEVQGYAVEAAFAGAALLDAFGRSGADRWRAYARALTGRFRDRFWVHDPAGDYPAIALDATGRRVDTVTSNIGHLLGTGILDAAGTADVARRLTGPDLDSGYGLRTLSAAARAYSPLSYHCGSVWPHDTAITVAGLARTGHGDAAASLVEGLLAAGAAFDGRLPELWSGDARSVADTRESGAPGVPMPVPYPAACRPQAWSAAAAVSLLTSVLGLDVDVPAGVVRLRPMRPSPVGALHVRGLRIGGGEIEVAVDAAGTVVAPTAASVAALGLRLDDRQTATADSLNEADEAVSA